MALTLAKLGMVKTVEITNFRNFDELKLTDLALVNIVVGDNGVGKTSLLEAIFLAVSGHSQNPLLLKQWRGLPAVFNSSAADTVVEGLYGDLFHEPDDPIRVKITGRGFENRSLVIEKTSGEVVVPTPNRATRRKQAAIGRVDLTRSQIVPVTLTWTDHENKKHIAQVTVGPGGLGLGGTNEKIPTCYMYAAQVAIPIDEPAALFSALRKRRETELFRDVFFSVFDQIEDISVESTGASAMLTVDVPWATGLIPLAAFSGGSNRVATILLSLTSRKDGLVLVDEIESGVYHARQKQFALALCELSRAYGSQLIMTSHSAEWLENFLSAVEGADYNIAFWRFERGKDNRLGVRRFTPSEFKTGLGMGEMR